MRTALAPILRSRSCIHALSSAILLSLVTLSPNQGLAQTVTPQNDIAAPATTTGSPETMTAQDATPPSAPSEQSQTIPGTQQSAPSPTLSDSAPPDGSNASESPTTPEAQPSSDQEPSTAPSNEASPETTVAPAPPESGTTVSNEQMTTLEQLLPAGDRSDIPHDLSPWGMFMAADWVVKAVMIGLAFASLMTWTVWLAKTLELMGARARAGRTLKVIRNAPTLADAVNDAGTRGGPAARMLRAAADEVRLSEASLDHVDGGGVKERVSSALSRIESFAGRRMARGTGMLATIGSTAPFVGLFGTVWGIMNSFIGISESQTTNLAVVAPGIAEALLATAIGLVAAIPAVVIYNVFARSITGYRHLLADAAAAVERLVSRDLDFRKIPPGSRQSPVSLVAGE